jgi:nitroimidazol reductase NimA-like FMN-containing flavoprotein (pyridoxamine 5'-phosphate oxidase superfamily)
MTNVAPSPVRLAEHESWLLLREAAVGRLAVVTDGEPDVFPVNHVVDRGTVVFRTAAGTKLSAAVGQAVAFEVDGYDPASGEAWSVVVKGRAREVRELDDVLDALRLPLTAWHAAPRTHLVRVVPGSVTGRRFHAVADEAGPVPG